MMVDFLTLDVLRIVREEEHENLIERLGGADKIQEIINTGNVEHADKVITEVLYDFISKDSKYFFEECRKAISSYDFKKEWSIDQ